jgi:uncharacterized protein YycO
MSLRRRLLRAVRPLSRVIDKINLRIGRPPLRGSLYVTAMGRIRPGDIILTRTAWRPTNLIFPGRWTHVLIVLREDLLVEAKLPRVRESYLVDVWASASSVKIVRPRFMTAAQLAEAALVARGMVGTPYDLEFEPGPKALYCSELVWRALRAVAGDAVPELRTTELGVRSVKPDAFDSEHFLTVIEGGS